MTWLRLSRHICSKYAKAQKIKDIKTNRPALIGKKPLSFGIEKAEVASMSRETN